jgi:hypothetical protein
VRLFCVCIVSSETASRPNKTLMRTYHWISLFMSYIVSKLAYRVWVILIANERVKKMEPEDSLWCSQRPATRSCPQTTRIQSIPYILLTEA